MRDILVVFLIVVMVWMVGLLTGLKWSQDHPPRSPSGTISVVEYGPVPSHASDERR